MRVTYARQRERRFEPNSPPKPYKLYSGTSDSGPSEIGTLYNKPLYKGHCWRSQKLHAL